MATFVAPSLVVSIQNRGSSSVSTSQLSFPSAFTVKYLVHYCGFPQQSAISISRNLHLLDETEMHRFNSTLNLLKSYGFERTHLVEIIRKRPRVIRDFNCDNKLRPKIDFLVEIGFSGSVLHDMISMNPLILASGMDSRIKPRFESLLGSLGSHERARAALMACPWLLTYSDWKPNIDILVREGVDVDTLVNLISRNRIALMQNVDEMVRAVDFVKNLGIDPALPKFLNAVFAVSNYPLWVKKAKVFESFGLLEDEVLSVLRRDPHCFKYSEKKLRSSFEFLVNTVKLSPKTISSHTNLLGLAMDKRVRPRYNVLEVLISKKLLGEGDAKIVHALIKTEKVFLEDYVYKHLDQIPNLLDVYHAKRMTKKTSNWGRLTTLFQTKLSP